MEVQIGNVQFNVVDGPNDWFWRRINRGDWEPETFRVFEERLGPDTTLFDIGAWIGATAMFAAHFAKRVIAFEPDPNAYSELTQNLALNPALANITVHQKAISTEAGVVKLGVRDKAGDSSSSLLLANDDSWQVPSTTLADVVAGGERPAFIKMDIEGHEFALIADICDVVARYKIPALVAVHPHLFGVARAMRIGRRTRLHKLAGSVAKRTIGRYEGFRAARSFAAEVKSNVVALTPAGQEIDLSKAATRVLMGQNLTECGSIIIQPRQ